MQINLWIIVIKALNKLAGEVRKILLTKATLRLSTFYRQKMRNKED